MARVWAQSQHAGSNLLMLLAIADFADDDGNAYPSVSTLAKKCRMSPRNANHVLAALRESGELTVRPCEGPMGTNRYRITVPSESAHPLKPASPPPPEARFTPPEEAFTLKPVAGGAEAGSRHPLKPASPKPSLNRQEPPGRARKAAKATAVPPEFTLTPELLAWAAERCPGVDVERETEKFRNHEFKEPRSDWPKAWRAWMLRAPEFGATRPATRRAAASTVFASRNYAAGDIPDAVS